MIVYFLLIILVNVISGDDSSDTKYIDTLPASVKKSLLDRVARRILNEVPEVNSGDTDVNGDILAERLEKQSDFVKTILRQEVESLKAKRRHFQKLKKFRKLGSDNDQLSIPNSENFDKNETLSSEIQNVKESVNDKIDADAGHIDLTLRSARSIKGDSGINEDETTTKDGLTEEHESHDGGFVPVEIQLDGANTDSKPSNDSDRNATEVLKAIKSSNEDIQIRKSKQSEEKAEKVGTETSDVTRNIDNVHEITTHSNFVSETTSNNDESPLKIHIGRRSEDLDINKTEEFVNYVTVDVSTISDTLKTNSNDMNTSENYTITPSTVEKIATGVKVSSSEIDNDAKNKTDRAFKYSSESYLENPIIDYKARKNIDVLNVDETTTQATEEASIKSEPVTEDLYTSSTETFTLTTTEAPFVATTIANQPLKSTDISSDVSIDLQKGPINVETTERNTKENKLLVIENSTATDTNKASTNEEVSNTSKIVHEKNSTLNDKKPCNETTSKVSTITDCDKKRNKSENFTMETPNLTEAQITEDEPKFKVTVDTVETGPKESLRTGHKKPLYDSLIHFGDMQIKKEYEVYELDSGKPAFVKPNDKDKTERNSMEQPRYAPVYNYDPENAYFNAYNRLGPNEDDKYDESESSELGIDKMLRSNDLRMSRIVKKTKATKQNKTNDVDNTTKPYFSKEASCEEEKSRESDVIIELPESHESGHIANPYTKMHLNHVRQSYFNHKIFGYVPTHLERKGKLAAKARYLYNNILGKSTEEILDETKEDENKILRTNDAGRYDEKDDASEDIRDYARKDAKDDNKLEVVVIDMNKNPPSVLRQGGYFSSKYKWDEEGNSFTSQGKVFNLEHIVPYSTEKSLILNQRKESNKIFDRIKNMVSASAHNNSVANVNVDPEDIKKTLDFLKNLDTLKTLFDKPSINEMVKGVEDLATPIAKDVLANPSAKDILDNPSAKDILDNPSAKDILDNPSAKEILADPAANLPPVPIPPRRFQNLKQRLANLHHHNTDMQNTYAILRSSCNKPHKKCQKNHTKKFKAPNDVLNSINKITQITPELDMLKNIEPMLQIDGLPIARSRDDDMELYVRILKDMVKLDNRALEEYDWLGTTVAVQSALAKLKWIIDQQKNGQRMHPSDLQLLNYVEELYTKASELSQEKEGDTLEDHIEDLKHVIKANNNERMALPKTHKKIKNPMKILLQISALMQKKVLRNKMTDRTKKLEVFLECIQQCLDDFHTAITEIIKITKHNNQRWYKNIKELYLAAGGKKEYLQVLLHLYSLKLFSLIEESAKNGVEIDYRMYMKVNRFEVDRAQAEMMFIIRILKAIHDLKVN